MLENIKKAIITRVKQIPGIHGFAPVDMDVQSIILDAKNVSKSIWIDTSGDEQQPLSFIKIAIIVSSEIPAKIIVKEVHQIIKIVFKTFGKKIDDIAIYVKGVK